MNHPHTDMADLAERPWVAHIYRAGYQATALARFKRKAEAISHLIEFTKPLHRDLVNVGYLKSGSLHKDGSQRYEHPKRGVYLRLWVYKVDAEGNEVVTDERS